MYGAGLSLLCDVHVATSVLAEHTLYSGHTVDYLTKAEVIDYLFTTNYFPLESCHHTTNNSDIEPREGSPTLLCTLPKRHAVNESSLSQLPSHLGQSALFNSVCQLSHYSLIQLLLLRYKSTNEASPSKGHVHI